MNLWETLLHPDREERENSDRRAIGNAANLLKLGDTDLASRFRR